jgi:hypothetical protein
MGTTVDITPTLDLSALASMAKTGIEESVRPKPPPEFTLDDLGELLSAAASQGSGQWHASSPPYWESLKAEFRLMLCSADSKYDGLREQFSSWGTKSQTAIVSSIAATMATYIGIAAGILVPFCALCLVAFLKLGKEAFCSAKQWDMRIE